MLFTRNEQRYLCAFLLIWDGIFSFIGASTVGTTANIVNFAVLIIVCAYIVLCLGLERESLPGYRLLTADESDEANDGSPVHFKVTGSIIGYAILSVSMLMSVFYYVGFGDIQIETAFGMESVCGMLLLFVGVIMLVAGRMRFTPFLFVSVGLIMAASSTLMDISWVCFFFYLVIGLVCLFRPDRRILVGIALLLYGCTYLISAAIGGNLVFLSVLLNLVPVIIFAYVSLALCSDGTMKLV